VGRTKDDIVQESAGGSGKWKQRGVPHRGWACVDVQDLGAPMVVCEMCEIVSIRYVHVMEHEDYDGQLGVGCVCAQHMEEDRIGPKRRERLLINAVKAARSGYRGSGASPIGATRFSILAATTSWSIALEALGLSALRRTTRSPSTSRTKSAESGNLGDCTAQRMRPSSERSTSSR
jgi:hypothetical protein